MTLETATKLIQSCAERMNARFKDVVFDEWAVISVKRGKRQILAYSGPRRAAFENNFVQDAGTLRSGLFAQRLTAGDFEFAHDGVGTGFESFTVLGEGLYLIWNNTAQCMDGISENPRWITAQVPFVELSDRFRNDPLAAA